MFPWVYIFCSLKSPFGESLFGNFAGLVQSDGSSEAKPAEENTNRGDEASPENFFKILRTAGIFLTVKGALGGVAERAGNFLSHGVFGTDKDPEVAAATTIENLEGKMASGKASEIEKLKYYESKMVLGRELSDTEQDDLAAAHSSIMANEEKKLADDVLNNFYKDSKETTLAKIAMMKKAGFDTTQVEQKVQGMRDYTAAQQKAAEEAKNQDLAKNAEKTEMTFGEKVKLAAMMALVNTNPTLAAAVMGAKQAYDKNSIETTDGGKNIANGKYYSQNDNATVDKYGKDEKGNDAFIYGGNMCQLTCLATVLDAAGVNQKTDKLFADELYDAAKSKDQGGSKIWGDTHTTYEKVAKEYNQEYSFQQYDDEGNNLDQKIKDLINSGKPVIAGSYTTEKGHVLVITGYDKKGWIVNDPYGDRNQGANDYGKGTNGAGQTYGKGVHYEYGKWQIGKTWIGWIK